MVDKDKVKDEKEPEVHSLIPMMDFADVALLEIFYALTFATY